MNKLMNLVIVLLLMTGCTRTIDLEDALKNVATTLEHETELYDIFYYDTGETCSWKLEDANWQIIMMHNKLTTAKQQVLNLIDATN